MAWFRFQSDTGLQAAYTDPINPLFNAISSAAPILICFGLHACVLRASGELLQSGVFLVSKPVRAGRLAEDAGGVSDRAPRQRSECAVYYARRTRQYLGAGPASRTVLHQRQSGLDAGAARIPLRHQQPHLSPERLRFRRRRGSDGHLHYPAAVHPRRGVDGNGNFPAGRFAAISFPQSRLLRARFVESDAHLHVDLWHSRHLQFESSESA